MALLEFNDALPLSLNVRPPPTRPTPGEESALSSLLMLMRRYEANMFTLALPARLPSQSVKVIEGDKRRTRARGAGGDAGGGETVKEAINHEHRAHLARQSVSPGGQLKARAAFESHRAPLFIKTLIAHQSLGPLREIHY